MVLGITVAYPTARLLVSSLLDWDTGALRERAAAAALRNTLLMGLASVASAGALGTALAFAVARFEFPGRGALSALAYLPYALPPLVGTLSFYYLIGTDGFLPRALHALTGGEEVSFSGPVAVLLIHTYSFYVFFYSMVSAALAGMDVSQLEAARTLGAGRFRAFRLVTLPMLTPALLGAALLTFMTSGASFSAPLYFGNDFPYLSVEIYKAHERFDESRALTLTIVLACISLLGVAIFRSRRAPATGGIKGAPRPLRSQGGRLIAGAAAWAFVALLLVPHFVIAYLSLVDHHQWFTEVFPTKLTLDNYLTIFRDPAAFKPIRNSLWISVVAALVTLFVGLQTGYLIGRRRPFAKWVNVLVMVPWALPGTVIAVNLITAFNDRWLPLYNTVFILPLAYFVRNIPLLTRMSTASIAQFDASLIDAARAHGASPWYCLRRVIVPLLAPALVAGTAMVFATSLGEFVASVLLWTPASKPIAVQIYEETRGAGIGSAFAYSMFLMIMVTGTFLFTRRLGSKVI